MHTYTSIDRVRLKKTARDAKNEIKAEKNVHCTYRVYNGINTVHETTSTQSR